MLPVKSTSDATSDADAPEGHASQPRNPAPASVQVEHQHTPGPLIRERELKSREASEQSGRHSTSLRLPILRFPTADGQTRLSLEALDMHNSQQKLTTDNTATTSTSTITNGGMVGNGQPLVDDRDDSDYDDMASSRSSDVYSPRFQPSLPTLVSRVATPDPSEPDELSLSGDTESNADTVSDQLDTQDDSDDFENIRHESTLR